MPRYYEIEPAFWAAMVIAPDGKKRVKTEDFVRELAKVNWFWTLHQANKWIESTVTTFRDVSAERGRTAHLHALQP